MVELAGIHGERDPEFFAFLDQIDSAQDKFTRGRADAFKNLWSHTDEVSLSGGHGGGIEVGWDRVAARLDWASSTYQEGDRSYQIISGHVGSDCAYVVRIEIIEAHIAGQSRRSRQELRVTMIFRRGPDGWRIVHRHADSQIDSSVPR
jgi:SnoaL-like domain